MNELDMTQTPQEFQRAVLLGLCQEAAAAVGQLDIERVQDLLDRASFVAAIIKLTDPASIAE